MSASDQQRWDAKYAARDVPERVVPDDWLTAQVTGMPPGRALELACGLGHNAVWLAQQGWSVDAVDVSPVGLQLAEELARRCGQQVHWIAADLDDYHVDAQGYDLVVVFRFLDRQHVPGLIVRALRPGGTLIYETFSRAQLERPDNHLRNPAFTLQPGELTTLFPGLDVLVEQEAELADRSVIQLVARR